MPTATNDRTEPIATIPKRDGEEVRIAWGSYNGHAFLDIRLYFRGPDGAMHPTRKGVTLAPDQLDALLTALTKAKATAPRAER